MDLGPRLKMAREAVGYTEKKAAEKTGIGVSSISEFECSKREPKFSQLAKLAEAYRRSVEFFLSDEPLVEAVMLWREQPTTEGQKETIEAEFRQLCEQYHRLELLTGSYKRVNLPSPDVTDPVEFRYKEAGRLAEKAQREFLLGDIPSLALQQTLEEKFHIKIFHLTFEGSAISTCSEKFGPAILLNRNKNYRSWRRNFDLAHELFHLLTWDVFRRGDTDVGKPTEFEEKLANAFASKLLLPTDSVKDRIDSALGQKGQITFQALDEIAREYGVSLQALLWRLAYLYNIPPEKVEEFIEQAASFRAYRPSTRPDEPDELPERYRALAVRALMEGKLSLMQFAKYMRISYRKAQEYFTENEDFTDEQISISVA